MEVLEGQVVSRSPSKKKKGSDGVRMDFLNALRQVMDGQKITRDEWEDSNTYGFMNNGLLSLMKNDKKAYQWIVSDGDMTALDWYVVK